MEIVNNVNATLADFVDVTEGDVFISNSITYMKTVLDNSLNAINMADGTHAFFNDSDVVSVPTATLTLTN